MESWHPAGLTGLFYTPDFGLSDDKMETGKVLEVKHLNTSDRIVNF